MFKSFFIRAPASVLLVAMAYLLASASPAFAADGGSGGNTAAMLVIAKLIICVGLVVEAWGLWVESHHSDHVRIKRSACAAYLTGALLTITALTMETTIA